MVGGACDDEFAEASEALFARVESGTFRLLLSPVVVAELRQAPAPVVAVYRRLEPLSEWVEVTDDVLALRDRYLASNVVTARWADDALHVALATVHGAAVIVSWNFKHLVNLDKIRGCNGVNLLNGYSTLEIRTPREVTGDEDEDL